MKRKLLILTMLLAMAFVVVPTDASSFGSQPGKNKSYGRSGDWQIGGWNKKGRRGKGRKKSHFGYKNYGQYRRTQVGNRRSRLVRRYYWRDGSRLSRLVRVFY